MLKDSKCGRRFEERRKLRDMGSTKSGKEVLRAYKSTGEWKSKCTSGSGDRRRTRERVMKKKIAVVVKQK